MHGLPPGVEGVHERVYERGPHRRERRAPGVSVQRPTQTHAHRASCAIGSALTKDIRRRSNAPPTSRLASGNHDSDVRPSSDPRARRAGGHVRSVVVMSALRDLVGGGAGAACAAPDERAGSSNPSAASRMPCSATGRVSIRRRGAPRGGAGRVRGPVPLGAALAGEPARGGRPRVLGAPGGPQLRPGALAPGGADVAEFLRFRDAHHGDHARAGAAAPGALARSSPEHPRFRARAPLRCCQHGPLGPPRGGGVRVGAGSVRRERVPSPRTCRRRRRR